MDARLRALMCACVCACSVGMDSASMLVGVHNLEDLERMGREKGWCPYYFTRHALAFANVVVYNYQVRVCRGLGPDVRRAGRSLPPCSLQYMLDPKVAHMVSKEFDSNCIVVFDEAHNIDNICIEALSVTLDTTTLRNAEKNVRTLESSVRSCVSLAVEGMHDDWMLTRSSLSAG